MRINLTHPGQALAAAALVVAAGSAAIPAVGIALAPLPSSATVAHVAALGCTRAAVCTTAVTHGVVVPYAGNATLVAGHAFYPIAPTASVAEFAAKPAFVCYDACQRN